MKTLPTNWTIDYTRPDSDKTGLCIRQGDVFFAFAGAQADIIIAALAAAEWRGIERSAEIIEQHSEYYQSNATDNEMKLSPRISGSLTGLAYARAIRALAQGGEKV